MDGYRWLGASAVVLVAAAVGLTRRESASSAAVSVRIAVARDVSPRLGLAPNVGLGGFAPGVQSMPRMTGAAAVEQTFHGSKPPAALVASFDGLGVGFVGPQGTATPRNPSDNTLAVGRDHIVQIVNTRMAIFTKKGKRFDTTGKVLYGPVETRNVFRGFGGLCEARNNGDAVARYDQLAERWLIVMPIFSRGPVRPDDVAPQKHGDPAQLSVRGRAGQPNAATRLFECLVIDSVNFLNNVDLDGTQLPPLGAPNIMLATGGAQLQKIMQDDGIYARTFHVDWGDPSKTKVIGPEKTPVAPYQYLCDGQLTNCVPQPGTDRRLDAQGDKIMARLVYRRIGNLESIVAVHSVNTSAGGGGVRWYEFRLDRRRSVRLFQQGTYAPDSLYRWMASPAIDARGNIGIGYSFRGTPHYAGQRFAGRLSDDPKGVLTLRETVLVEGAAAQTTTLRWEDYTQTAVDPSVDCTIWYVGDYLKKDATSYSTRIGAFRLPGCVR
ncbi:MAG: hypothetical protein ACT4P6_04975 [Gemmatimonadaceae bacterium]